MGHGSKPSTPQAAAEVMLHRALVEQDPVGQDLVALLAEVLGAAASSVGSGGLRLESVVDAVPPALAPALRVMWPRGAVLSRREVATLVGQVWLRDLSVTGQVVTELSHPGDEGRPRLDLDLWEEKADADEGLEQAMSFHKSNNEATRKHFPNWGGAYLDGSAFELHDVIFQVLAVTSVSAPLGYTLTAAIKTVQNFKEHLPEIREARARVEIVRQRIGKEPDPELCFSAIFDDVPSSERSSRPLFAALTAGTHPYLHCQQAIFEILAGRTLDTWDSAYLQLRPSLWGRRPLELSDYNTGRATAEAIERLGPRWAFIESHGPRAAARILSYHDCLRNPETSSAVVLDATHAKLFGRPDWFAAGAYHEVAEEIRAFASGPLSDELGREVRPHEVATALSRFQDSEGQRQFTDAGAALLTALRGGPKDLGAMGAFFVGKEDARHEQGAIGKLGSALKWLVGSEPELEFSVAPHGRGNQGELRLFSFTFAGRHFVFLVGEDTLGPTEIVAVAKVESEEACDDAVCEALARVPGLLGVHGALRLRSGRRVWGTARHLAEEQGFAPWDTDALKPFTDRMGGTFPVVSTYTDPLAESCGFDEDVAASLIEGVLDHEPVDEEDRDVAWTLLFLLRDDQAPPADFHRQDGEP